MYNELCLSTTCNTTTFYNLSIICSLVILFSPSLVKFIFIVTLILLCIIVALFNDSSKRRVVEKMVGDKVGLKMKRKDYVESDEFRDFEECEIYKLVFDDQPLIISTAGEGGANGDQLMENEESERELERLFEELDRFENSTRVDTILRGSLHCVSHIVNVTGGVSHSLPFINVLQEDPTKAVEVTKNGILKLEAVVISNSNEDQKTVKTNFSSSFGSYKLMKSDLEEARKAANKPYFSEKVKTIKSNVSSSDGSISAEDQKTTKSSTSRSFRRYATIEEASAALKTKSAENKKLVENSFTAKRSSSVEDQKTVENYLISKPNPIHLDSSSSSGSYGLTKPDLEVASSPAISTSGDDENTIKSSSSSSFASYESPKSDLGEISTSAKSFSIEDKKSESSIRVNSSSSFGSYGSMRKEKEWKRTLACKLFEERRNSEGGEEGMDSLWESYEEDTLIKKSKNKKDAMSSKKKTMVKSKNKSELKYFYEGDSDDDDDEDEYMSNSQLCCLKALKLSAGKMNLGMGKPNLVKFSKALKGFGWLHHVGGKHAKKC